MNRRTMLIVSTAAALLGSASLMATGDQPVAALTLRGDLRHAIVQLRDDNPLDLSATHLLDQSRTDACQQLTLFLAADGLSSNVELAQLIVAKFQPTPLERLKAAAPLLASGDVGKTAAAKWMLQPTAPRGRSGRDFGAWVQYMQIASEEEIEALALYMNQLDPFAAYEAMVSHSYGADAALRSEYVNGMVLAHEVYEDGFLHNLKGLDEDEVTPEMNARYDELAASDKWWDHAFLATLMKTRRGVLTEGRLNAVCADGHPVVQALLGNMCQ